jgi:hypothetical protein
LLWRAAAPFAFHDKECMAALQYLQCCLRNEMNWNDAAAQINQYLGTRGVTAELL